MALYQNDIKVHIDLITVVLSLECFVSRVSSRETRDP